MTDSERQQTIQSMLKDIEEQYHLKPRKPVDHASLNPEQVGTVYGWSEIISPIRAYNKEWHSAYVLVKCRGCGTVKWQNLTNLTRGQSKGCQHCSQPRQIPKWLDRRLTAQKQRCENPNDKQYPRYGGRGIKFCFDSVTEAGLYLMDLYGENLTRDLEIDRIDNNGNYESGNLRLVTHADNNRNKRNTVLSEWDPQYWPYAENVVKRYLVLGYSREEIIELARKAVRDKRKNWRGIQARLESMTYEMPDRITVLPYRGGSSTTVDSEDPSEH